MPATGHGCGCQICADAHAERVRRTRPLAAMRGRIARLIEKLVSADVNLSPKPVLNTRS